MANKAVKMIKDNFEVHVKYSDEAIEKKLIKFIIKDNNEIVVSADELMNILVTQVNAEILSAAFVESERINVVEVGRQIKCILDRDYKAGETININYTHPYPLEFALIEEVWKIAKIQQHLGVTELTSEMIEDVKKQIKPQMVEYMQKFYKSFKNINTNKKMEETNKVVEGTEEIINETGIGGVSPETAEETSAEETPELAPIEETPVVEDDSLAPIEPSRF